MGRQVVSYNFPYVVKAEQMSPSIGRERPGGFTETVFDMLPCEKTHN